MSQDTHELLIEILNLQQSLENLVSILKEDLSHESKQAEIKQKMTIEAIRDSCSLPEVPKSIRNHPKHRYA